MAVTLQSTLHARTVDTMPSGVTRAIRLISLMKLFYAGGRHTTRDLAERFRVTQRTIQNDLQDLDVQLHMPLYRIGYEWELYDLNEMRPKN